MRRVRTASALLALMIATTGLGGCGGDDKKTDTIVESPEAKKANEGAMQGMQDMMKTKGAPKKK